MGTKFAEQGKSYFPTSDEALNLKSTLPVGNYLVQFSMERGLFFTRTDDFKLPPKMYGSAADDANRIMNTFKDRGGSTGVLLAGEKGSGKTLLSKLLSAIGKDMEMPTIIINNDFCGDNFNQLMQNLEQPCIVMFDEFEKVYDKQHQEQLLTLLDGVFQSKKLYLFTVNDRTKLDNHMMNRPGRIFYYKEYKGLDTRFIREYCEDNLRNKDHIGAVVAVAGSFYQFNFDILKALVEEMNRYSEDAFDAIKMLNAKPDQSGGSGRYKVEVEINGTAPFAIEVQGGRSIYLGNPLMAKEIHLAAYLTQADKDKARAENEELEKAEKWDEAENVWEKHQISTVLTQQNISLVKDGGDFVEYLDKAKNIVCRLTRVWATEEVTGLDTMKGVAHLLV